MRTRDIDGVGSLILIIVCLPSWETVLGGASDGLVLGLRQAGACRGVL